jgi:hypothetical protein
MQEPEGRHPQEDAKNTKTNHGISNAEFRTQIAKCNQTAPECSTTDEHRSTRILNRSEQREQR